MTLKRKLFTTIAMFCLTFALLLVGVWALSTASIEIGETISFTDTAMTASVTDCDTSVTSLNIPKRIQNGDKIYNVTNIGDNAFFSCSSLTSITLSDYITSIGIQSLMNCSGLTGTLTIPDSVTNIGQNAFWGCSGLTSIKIPDSVTSIGNSAFSSCSNLTSITIPDSVTSIGSGAFHYCSKLTTVIIDSETVSIGLISNSDMGYIIDAVTTIYIKTGLTVEVM